MKQFILEDKVNDKIIYINEAYRKMNLLIWRFKQIEGSWFLTIKTIRRIPSTNPLVAQNVNKTIALKSLSDGIDLVRILKGTNGKAA